LPNLWQTFLHLKLAEIGAVCEFLSRCRVMGNRIVAPAVKLAGTRGFRGTCHMYRVAGAINVSISPATWTAALVVVAGWVAGALFIANHIASTPQPPVPQKILAAPEASQTPNRAAKAAREPFKQARLAPDPSILGASRQTPEDEPALGEPPQDEASLRDIPSDDAAPAQGQTGRASWYDLEAKTASGEAMDGEALTAAHPSLPFGSKVTVANLDNGRSVVVRINDRGPFSKGRIIDVSRAAAEQLGMIGTGVARVSVNPVDSEVISASAGSSPFER
jgi:rare lipoprotein A